MNAVFYRIFRLANQSQKRFIHINRVLSNHYDTLNLKTCCTAKEIKDSFIKLSKENHPDLNQNTDAHKRFIKINEAYKVLSNAESRQLYDLGLAPSKFDRPPGERVTNVHYQPNADPWKNPYFYSNRDRSQDAFYENKPYYGIKGIERMSNGSIALICVAVAAFFVSLQFLAIAKSVTFQRDELIRKSNEAGEELRRSREAADKNGNKLQIELMRMKFEGKYRED